MHLKLLPPMLSHHKPGNSACKLVHSKLRPLREYSNLLIVVYWEWECAPAAAMGRKKPKTSVEEIMLSEINKTNNGLQPFSPTMGKLISSLGRIKIAP